MGENGEGEKGLREGGLGGQREGLQKSPPSLLYLWIHCALRAFISGSEKSFYPLLSLPGSGAPKVWTVILPGVGGGSRFPVWPSLPLSASSACTTPLTQFASCLQGGQ